MRKKALRSLRSTNNEERLQKKNNRKEAFEKSLYEFGDFVREKPLEELILSYMQVALVMSTCRRWSNIVEKHPDKMRPQDASLVSVTCTDKKDHYNLEIHSFKSSTGTQTIKLNECPTSDLITKIRYSLPKTLVIMGFNENQPISLIDSLPLWWKSSITETRFIFHRKYPQDTINYLKFWCIVTDLSSVVLEDKSFDNALSCVNAMSSIRLLELGGRCNDADSILEALCHKSNRLERLISPISYTAEALINFLENASFGPSVFFQIAELHGPNCEEKLGAFLLKTKKCEMTVYEYFVAAEFWFRDINFKMKIMTEDLPYTKLKLMFNKS